MNVTFPDGQVRAVSGVIPRPPGRPLAAQGLDVPHGGELAEVDRVQREAVGVAVPVRARVRSGAETHLDGRARAPLAPLKRWFSRGFVSPVAVSLPREGSIGTVADISGERVNLCFRPYEVIVSRALESPGKLWKGSSENVHPHGLRGGFPLGGHLPQGLDAFPVNPCKPL